ncbi:hypothetical protein CPB83DRAFT_733979, partial [Crepidotus variabilis]
WQRYASIIYQLRTGHAPLAKHLYRIGKEESPYTVERCKHGEESVNHFLIRCLAYRAQRQQLYQKAGRDSTSMTKLLSEKKLQQYLIQFLEQTEHF